MKRNILFLLLLIQYSTINGMSSFTKPEMLSSLSMEQAVNIAHKNRPSLMAFKQIVYTSQISEKKTWTGYYPLITWANSLNHGRGQKHPLFSSYLSAQQLIYDFAGPQELYKQAKINTAIQEYKQQEEANNVQLAVEVSFLECWRLQKQKKAIEDLLHSSSSAFNKTENQKNVELIKQNDYLVGAETHALNLKTVYQYDDSLMIAQKLLEFLMGRHYHFTIGSKKNPGPITNLRWNSIVCHAIKPLDYYLEQAISHRPEIKEQEKNVAFQQQAYNIAIRTRLPSLSINAQAGYDESCRQNFRAQRSYGITVGWNIFDQLASDYNADIAQSQKLTALFTLQEVSNRIKSEVETTYYSLQQEYTALKAEWVSYQRGKNQFILQSLQFKNELISQVDFDAALTQWANQQFSWISQVAKTATQERELLHHCGYFSQSLN